MNSNQTTEQDKSNPSYSGYESDQPIKRKEQDKYKIFELADRVVKEIIATEEPKGTCVAISAKWGAGKTSTLNLIREKIAGHEKKDEFVFLKFECWHQSNRQAMVTAFYSTLAKAIDEIEKRTSDNQEQKIWCKAAKLALSLKKLQWQGTLNFGIAQIGVSADNQPDPQEPDTSALHADIEKCLYECKKKFIVEIDDVDRLSPEEILLVLKLLKSVGDLSNIIYLIALDSNIVERVIEDRYPYDGKDYLEKFVMAQEKLETSDRQLLIEHLMELLHCEEEPPKLKDFKVAYQKHGSPKAEDIVISYADTPRKVRRFANYLNRLNFNKLCQKVNAAELLVLKTLAFFEEDLYDKVKFQARPLHGDELENIETNPYLALVKPANRSKAFELLNYLFLKHKPEDTEFTNYHATETKAARDERDVKEGVRRVRRPISDPKYYPLYFGAELKKIPPIKEVISFIDNAYDQAKLRDKLLQLKDLSTMEDNNWKPSKRREQKPENSLDFFLAEVAGLGDFFDEEQATTFLCLLFREPSLIILNQSVGELFIKYRRTAGIFFAVVRGLYADKKNNYQGDLPADEAKQKQSVRKQKFSEMLLAVMKKADLAVLTCFLHDLGPSYHIDMDAEESMYARGPQDSRIELFIIEALKKLCKSTYERILAAAKDDAKQIIGNTALLYLFLGFSANLAVSEWPGSWPMPSQTSISESRDAKELQKAWSKKQMLDDYSVFQFINIIVSFTRRSANNPNAIDLSRAEKLSIELEDLTTRAKELRKKNYGSDKEKQLIREFLDAVEKSAVGDREAKEQATAGSQNNQVKK